MGKVVGAIAVIGASVAGFALGGPIWGLRAGVGTALLLYRSASSAPKRARKNVATSSPPRTTKMEENIPLPRVYGEVFMSGNIIQVWNRDVIVGFCEGEIESFSDVTVDDVILTNDTWTVSGTTSVNGSRNKLIDFDTLGYEDNYWVGARLTVTHSGTTEYRTVVSSLCNDGSVTVSPNFSFTISKNDTYKLERIIYDMYLGTRTQIADTRFDVAERMAYRDVAYIALTLPETVQASGNLPNVSTKIKGLLCRPLSDLSTGTKTWSNNNAVVLADFLINVYKVDPTKIDLTTFQALESYCNTIPTGQTTPRYHFNYCFDSSGMSKADALFIIEESFMGRVIESQGVWKVLYEYSKSSVFAFTVDNIVYESVKVKKQMIKNIIRVRFINSTENNITDVIEIRDDNSIDEIGEQILEEDARYINHPEIAGRRAQLLYDKYRTVQVIVEFSALVSAGAVELLDVVTITHVTFGFDSKLFMIINKSEDANGLVSFTALEYNSYIYHDGLSVNQESSVSTLPNPYSIPNNITNLTLSQSYRLSNDGTWIPQIGISFTKSDCVFAVEYEIWVKIGSTGTYELNIKTYETSLKIDAFTQNTYYIRVRTCIIATATTVKSSLSEEKSIEITHKPITVPEGFDIITEFGDALEGYPASFQREVIQYIKNYYDPTSGSVISPIVVSNFEYGSEAVKEFQIKCVHPIVLNNSEVEGSGTVSTNKLTDSSHNWVDSSLIGNKLILFSNANYDDGEEYTIVNIASDGGSGTIFTLNGTPALSGNYIVVSSKDTQ